MRERRFNMQYGDVFKMRELYPFLENSDKGDIIGLLDACVRITPEDTEFADACRLELLWRHKQHEKGL